MQPLAMDFASDGSTLASRNSSLAMGKYSMYVYIKIIAIR